MLVALLLNAALVASPCAQDAGDPAPALHPMMGQRLCSSIRGGLALVPSPHFESIEAVYDLRIAETSSVWVYWTVTAPELITGTSQAFDVDGHVTDVAWIGDTLYVAIWSTDELRLTIEAWRYTLAPLVGDELPEPARDVTTLFRSEPGTIGPLWSLASHREDGALLALEHDSRGPRQALHRVDLRTGELTTLHTSDDEGFAALGTMRTMWSPVSATSGRVITLTDFRPFARAIIPGARTRCFVLVDRDRDGTIDERGFMTFAERERRYAGPWIADR